MNGNVAVNIQQQAIVAIAGISVFKRYDDKALIKGTNHLLVTGGYEPLSEEEFNSAIEELVELKVLRKNKKYWEILGQPQPLNFRNDEQRAQFLNEPLFLENDEVQGYVIEFNCDGKGGKRLPDGKVVNTSLASLTQELRQEYNITRGDSSGVNNWVVSAAHHPTAPSKKTERKLRNYLRLLDEQDPSRRRRIK